MKKEVLLQTPTYTPKLQVKEAVIGPDGWVRCPNTARGEACLYWKNIYHISGQYVCVSCGKDFVAVKAVAVNPPAAVEQAPSAGLLVMQAVNQFGDVLCPHCHRLNYDLADINMRRSVQVNCEHCAEPFIAKPF